MIHPERPPSLYSHSRPNDAAGGVDGVEHRGLSADRKIRRAGHPDAGGCGSPEAARLQGRTRTRRSAGRCKVCDPEPGESSGRSGAALNRTACPPLTRTGLDPVGSAAVFPGIVRPPGHPGVRIPSAKSGGPGMRCARGATEPDPSPSPTNYSS